MLARINNFLRQWELVGILIAIISVAATSLQIWYERGDRSRDTYLRTLEVLTSGDYMTAAKEEAWSSYYGKRTGNFRGMKLGEINFHKGNFKKSDFSRAHLKGANLRESDFTEATFQATELNEAKLRGAVFIRATFVKALLHNANFDEADVKDAVFSRTVVKGSDFSNVKNMTQQQMDNSCGDTETKVPKGITPPPLCENTTWWKLPGSK